jgi:peptide methionine sulfoxide reductase msrA/msrB
MIRERFRIFLLLMALGALGAVPLRGSGFAQDQPERSVEIDARTVNQDVGTFAGGCFWCVEADFEKVPGVIRVISGHTGGNKENPTYEEVSAGGTGHLEAVQVVYDPDKVSYGELLSFFWRHIDPTDPGGQFVDRGAQYRSAIFYHNEEQRRQAEESRRLLGESGRFSKPVVTEILPFTRFYMAEVYHQDFYKSNRLKYSYYRWRSGRDQFLEKVWGKDQKTALREAPPGKQSFVHGTQNSSEPKPRGTEPLY